MRSPSVISSLTSLRFFAALAIFIHHCNGILITGPTEKLPLSTGVGFFFVLSGYILSHVYLSSNKPLDSTKFLVYRFARVWPAHIAALVLLVSILPEQQWVKDGVNVALAVASNVTMLHSLIPIPDYYFSFNWVSWSISTEFVFYLAFPAVVLAVGRGLKFALWCFLAVSLVGFVIAYVCDVNGLAYYPADSSAFNSHGITYISPISRFQEFCIGVMANVLVRHVSFSALKSKVVSTALEFVMIAAFLLSFVTFYYWLKNVGFRTGPAMSEYFSHYFSAFFFALVVVVFAKCRGYISDLLSFRFFVTLGEISFSFYLVHQILLRYYISHQDQFMFISPAAKPYFLFVLSLILSYELWQWVEKPAQSMIRNLFEKIRARTHAQPSPAL